MFLHVAAKRLKCSPSYLNQLIKDKKVNAELRPTKTGRKSWFITEKLDSIKPKISTRAGFKKNGSSKVETKSNLLTELVEWRAIPIAKRSILLSLSKFGIKELKILLDLIKS